MASGAPFHYNLIENYINAEATFTGSTLPPPCAPGKTYIWSSAIATFQDDACPHEPDNSDAGYIPATLDTGLIQDFAPGCDLFAPGNLPSDVCKVGSPVNAQTRCSNATQYIVLTEMDSPDPQSCLTTNNIVLSYLVWESFGTIGVYIDSTYWPNSGGTAATWNAICRGFLKWGTVDGATYSCHSSAGAPPSTTTAPYVFVTESTTVFQMIPNNDRFFSRDARYDK